MSTNVQRLKQLLADALALPAVARREFVERNCAGDAALRDELERLLKAHESAGDFLEQSAVPLESDLRIETVGCFIGRYKLLQGIGEGGFGRVFMAEQTEPVHRKVALKIVKAGMDTREVIARFEAERQALALMEHPNIARVLDAGATDAGRPYFVMELVRGIPITDYCDRNNLPMENRLQLFIKVCQAVQHAHQKGIIHRDLKPTNILVTVIDGEPVPKVIDFGVAKALGQRLTEKTLFTRFEEFIGTPAYMSPEQAELSGVDVDTRSDIYSLGVLLYELLTGVTPFDDETFRKVALDEIRRIIREVAPPKPSTRLQALVAADVRRLKSKSKIQNPESETNGAFSRGLLQIKETIRLVHGDLDWIVMKCLEKERARRYETANSLLEDIQRHLKHQPVQASPPGAVYWAGKFIRRHRVGVATVLLLVTVIVLALVISLAEYVQARQERNRAVLAEEKALKERDRAVQAEEAELVILDSFVDQSVENRKTIPLLEEGTRIAQERLGPTNKTYLRLLQPLARRFGSIGEWNKALEHYQMIVMATPNDEWLWWCAHAAALAVGNQERSRELSAGMLARFGDSPDPAVRERVAISLLFSPNRPADVQTASRLANLAFESAPDAQWSQSAKGMAEFRSGHFVEAETLFEQARTTSDPRLECLAGYFQAMALQKQGKTGAAQQILKEANERFKKILRTGDLGWRWHDCCLDIAARAEAERLILGREISPPVTAESLAGTYRERKAVTNLLQTGYALAKDGKWGQSAEQFAQALRHPALDWEKDRNVISGGRLELLMAMAFVKAHDRASHEQVCRFLLDWWDSGYKVSPVDIERFVRVCFLDKDGLPADLQMRGLELARFAETNQMNHPLPHWMILSSGIAEYRAGEYGRAIELLRQINSAKDQWGAQITCRGESLTFRAMALKRLGRESEAITVLAKARELQSKPIQYHTGADWPDLELCQMVLDEAQELFGSDSSQP